MASTNFNINDKNASWGDLVLEEKPPAAAGAGTPQKEKGWTEVKGAPKKSKKTESRTKNTASAGSVVKTLDFSDGKKPYADPNNKFAVLAEDSE